MNISYNKIAWPMLWSLASTRLFLAVKSVNEGLQGSNQKILLAQRQFKKAK